MTFGELKEGVASGDVDVLDLWRHYEALHDRTLALEARISQAQRELADSPGRSRWPTSCLAKYESICLRPAGHEGAHR